MRLLLVFLLFQASAVYAQFAGFKATVQKDEILIGEQTRLLLEISAGSTDTIVFPIFNDTLISEIEIIQRSKVDTNYLGNNLETKVLKQQLTITSFDSGYYAISPLSAVINQDTIQSNPFLVSVKPVPIDTAKGIYDIRGVAQAPFSITEWLVENWKTILAIVLLIAIIISAYWWWKNKPKHKEVEISEPQRPAHEIALEKIAVLRMQKLWQDGKTKEYYTQLSYILREYIELRFDIPALEQTTDEIIQTMRLRPSFSQELLNETKQVLSLADLVKFAKENPVGNENERNLDLIEAFINSTKSENPTAHENG